MPASRSFLRWWERVGWEMSNKRHQLADADLAGVFEQNVDELQADRIAEGLGDFGHAQRVVAGDLGIGDRLAAALAGGPLLLGGQFQIDGHLYTHINNNHACQCNTMAP